MSRILVLGGHGKVALLLSPLLVERGHEITGVVRNPAHVADVESTGAAARVADIEALDTDGIATLARGHDAIVWVAGAGGGDPRRTWAVDRDAAIRSIDAASAAGIGRYVMLSYFGAGPDHGVPEDDDFFAYAEAKSAADEHLRASGADYTILAPSALTLDEPTGRIDVSATEATSVGRADVAGVIAQALAEPATIGRTIRFNAGTVPIADALRG